MKKNIFVEENILRKKSEKINQTACLTYIARNTDRKRPETLTKKLNDLSDLILKSEQQTKQKLKEKEIILRKKTPHSQKIII